MRYLLHIGLLFCALTVSMSDGVAIEPMQPGPVEIVTAQMIEKRLSKGQPVNWGTAYNQRSSPRVIGKQGKRRPKSEE